MKIAQTAEQHKDKHINTALLTHSVGRQQGLILRLKALHIPRRIIALAIAPAVLATALVLVPTTVSAQEIPEEDSASQIDSVFSLLSFEDLEYLTPLEPEQRREFLEFELSLLIEIHDLTLTADERSTLIDSWLALLADHEP